MIAAYAFGLTKYLTFASLQEHQRALDNIADAHRLLAPLLFIGLYIAVAALSLPVAIFVSILGGFLFAQPFCTIYIVIGGTIGACIVFLAARTAVGDLLRKKAGPHMERMKKEFLENGVSYLLFLRFVPLFPFWLVNLAPAFFGVRLWTFCWTTLIGIIPGGFVSSQAGRGLRAILDSGESFSIHSIFNTQVKIALFALAIFALLPVIIKKLCKKH